ncbi:MAG: hypothetical protein J6A59_08490 [Lachnospiraceae bacterium]|nr:hypothetical protein [Lachnospiraceae bacterium]
MDFNNQQNNYQNNGYNQPKNNGYNQPMNRINNTFVWLFIVICITEYMFNWGAVLLGVSNTLVTMIFALFKLIVFFLDWNEIKKAGIRGAWVWWGIFIVPIYLLFRAMRVDNKYAPLITWLICWVIGILITVFIAIIASVI